MTFGATQAAIARMLVGAAPIAESPELASAAAQIAAGSAQLSPEAQVEVYREQFWLRHVGSLAEDYATLVHLLGGERFEELVRGFLAAHPPRGFRLRDLGTALPAYVASAQPWSADPLLADCARLEWALVEAFDAADVAPLDASRIAGLGEDDWPVATLVLDPSVRVLSARFPVDVFRTAVRTGAAPSRPSEEALELVAYRRSHVLYVERVSAPARVLLASLLEGMPLGAACERAAQAATAEEIEASLPQWFQRWTALGWIADVRVPARP